MWWADGWRGRSADGRLLRCVQTGRYAMALDVERMAIAHLGAVEPAVSYEAAGLEDNRAVLGLPGASLDLTLAVDGTAYRCVRGSPPALHSGPRLVESGRFVQRADVTDLVFESADGSRLNAEARLETVAWPDRLTLLLEARPGRAPLVAGPSFGRVGGGYAFDGTNHLEFAHAPALEPAELTLALWVYVTDEPPVTAAYPWLVCKSGNEWVDGHYGLALIGSVPRVFLNIGGGRENAHAVSASSPLPCEQWHHLATTYDGQTLRLYVDGREAGSREIGRPRSLGGGPLALGRRQDNSGDGYHFRGVLDEVRVYGRALSAAEVAAQAQASEAVGADPGLGAEWCFDPQGPALAERPGGEWREALMRLRLAQGDLVHEAQVATQTGAAWTREAPLTVAVSLDPATGRPARSAEMTVTAAAMERQPRPVEYDPLRDWHVVDLDGLAPQGTHNDSLERVRVTVSHAGTEGSIARLMFRKTAGGFRVQGIQALTGMSPMLRDEAGCPLGIPVQLSKNWHSRPERDLIYQGAWLHAFTMLRLPPRSQTTFEFTLAYAHWGGVAAASHAQLCLIGWGSNQLWDQSALGAWGESICYEPDQAQAEAGVLDVRPVMVNAMGCDEPVRWTWTNNVGGADFFRYFDASGRRVFPARMRTTYRRHGPVLTEVTYAGGSQDGKLAHRATVSLYRSDDLVRGLYRLRLDVREPADCSRFVICQIGADTYGYTGERKMAVGNETGLLREWDTRWGGNTYRTPPIELPGRVPWVSLHEAVSRDDSRSGAWANRGLVIREWRAVLGGRPAAPFVAEYGVGARGQDTSVIDLLPPPNVKRLLPGDFVEATIEHLVLPQSAPGYYGPNDGLRAALEQFGNTWRLVHREAVGNDLAVKATRGALMTRRPTTLRAQNDAADFTISGGLGHVPITIVGLSRHATPVLEQQAPDGTWTRADQSVHGNDFWQTDFDAASGTWEITYSVPLGASDSAQGLRFHLD
jgi:hypothetical protein